MANTPPREWLNNLCGKRVGIVAGNVADFTADKLNETCKKAGLPEITKAVFPEAKDAPVD